LLDLADGVYENVTGVTCLKVTFDSGVFKHAVPGTV
jgi:hypothetical protein